jgi:hypothetical protein
MSASTYTWTSLSEINSATDSSKLIYKLIDMKMENQHTNDLTYLISNKFILLFLYIVLSIFVYLSAIPGYVFAYLKYRERFQIEESLFLRSTAKNRHQQLNLIGSPDDLHSNQSFGIYSIIFIFHEKVKKLNLSFHFDLEKMYKSATKKRENITCCFSYCPHLIATIQLIIICACKMPFCYDYIIYFNNLKDFGIMLCIIVEIMHTIILLFVWLTLTLRTEWNMHLQTGFSICHWTYHVKVSENELRKEIKKRKEKMSFEINNTAIKAVSNINMNASNPNESLAFNNNINSSHYDNHQVMIRNKSNSRVNSANIYNQVKHKSMFVDDKFAFDSNSRINQIDMIDSNSDCLLNSETMYRNEIRKSIRNVLQQKKGGVLSSINSSSISNYNNTRLKSYINTNKNLNQSVLGLNNNSTLNGGKQLCNSGIYLTSSIPVASSISNTANNTSSNSSSSASENGNNSCNSTNNKRPILYLENKNSSTEYESRV